MDSPELLGRFVAALAEPAAALDEQGHLLSFNVAGGALWGEVRAHGYNLAEVWHPWPSVDEMPVHLESLHRPSGRWFHHHFTRAGLGWLVISHERQPHEAIYKALFKATRDGILVVDDAGYYVEVNESLSRILKAPRERLIGAHFGDFIPKNRLQDAVAAFEALKQDQPTPVEFPLQAIDGSTVELEWSTQRSVLPGLHVCTCRDVTHVRREAERLRRNEESMRLAHEAARIGTWYLDLRNPEGSQWSPEAYVISGFDPSWQPKYEEWLARVHPEDRERVNRVITSSFAPGTEGYTVAYRLTGHDGVERWHESRGRVSRDRSGAPTGATGITLDITAAKQAEQELRAAHTQLRVIVDNSPLPIVMLARTGDVTLWNPAAERLFGWSESEVLGRPLPFIPEERIHEHLQMRQSDLAGKNFRSRYIRRKRRDGTLMDLTVSTALLHDSDGEVWGILSIYSDITEYQNVLHQLSDTAERLRLSLEASGMGDWMWDQTTDLVHFSQRAADIFEIPAGPQMTWTEMRQLLHPDDQERAQIEVERCLREREDYSIEYRVRTNEQSWRWVAAKGRPLCGDDGSLRGMIGVVGDVTARRDSEAVLLRLHNREQQARQTAELLNRVGPAMLAELDPAKLAQQAVDLATQLTGADHGTFSWSSEPGTPSAIVVSGQCPENPGSALSVPVVSRSGQVLGVFNFVHADENRFAPRHSRIAAGIAAQAAIAIDNAHLFAESERSARVLEQMNQELRRTNEDLEHFAWSASHDLQEPLRQVATFSQLLRRRYSGQLDESADQFLNYIVQGAKRMESLVRDILAYTHVSRAELHADLSAIEASSVLKNVINAMEQAIIDCGARIEADPLPVLAVRDVHLERLFQNLLSNAIKYRSDRAPRIRVAAAQDSGPGFWHLSVSDNGIGIDPRYHEQVFALFRRLHTSAEYEGTGIGLAICHKIVERYGGRIWVESQLNNGTTFHFTLPGVQR